MTTQEPRQLRFEGAESKASLIARRFDDVDNSIRLIHLHGDRLRYVTEWGTWIVWDGTRWLKDPKRVTVFELAKDVSSALYRQAAENPDAAEKTSKWANQSATRGRISSMVELARGIEGVVISQTELDADPWLLGVKNGYIDLRTGTFHQPDPEKLMTMQAPVTYDPDAKAPRWRQALREWFPDEDTRHYVQRLSGHAVAGDSLGGHIFVIHYGDGRNGKGTFMGAHKHVLGEYYVTPDKSLLIQQRRDEHATVKVRLFRTRLAVASETDQREHLNEAQVKNLTGGDPINARRMREDEWEFVPTHSLWLQTNYLPEISGNDNGIWSRIKVVPWTVTFGGQIDSDLDSTLTNEGPGILNWLIEGCLDWQTYGLREPEAVIRATLDYRTTEDVLTHFAQDTGLVFGAGHSVVDSSLKERIRQWAFDSGVEGPSVKRINAWMKANGCAEGRQNYSKDDGTTSKRKVWKGVRFTAPDGANDLQPAPSPGTRWTHTSASPPRKPYIENKPDK